ncbi:MAG: hypothetical protein U0836_09555 [Pirellulales bacterium]
MGLDAHELILEVEDEFHVRFSDAELEKTLTVGQFHELICRRISAGSSSRCISQMAFYRVRAALVKLADANRADVRPAASLANLLPLGKRIEFWNRFREETGLALPALSPLWEGQLSRWWSYVAAASVVLVAVGIAAALGFEDLVLLLAGLSLALVSIAGALGLALSPRLCLGEDFQTVGGLAHCVLSENLSEFAAYPAQTPTASFGGGCARSFVSNWAFPRARCNATPASSTTWDSEASPTSFALP